MSFRIEEKIPVSPSDATLVLNHIHSNGANVLYPARKISSQYFDSSSNQLLRDSEEGLLPRKKIRIRHYPWGESKECLEVKTSSIEGRFKTTKVLTEAESKKLKVDGFFDPQYGLLKPVVQVEYQREYFFMAGVRITLDSQIEYRTPGKRLPPYQETWKVIEIKAPVEAGIDFLSNLIASPRRRFSKYSNAMLALAQQV